MSLVLMPTMYFLSPLMVSFFSDNETIRNTGVTYLRIDALAFYGYVVLFQSVAVLQAMQKPLFPMYMGIAGQLIIPASINYLLIVKLGYPMVSMHYTIVIVVVLSAVLTYFYTRREIRRIPIGAGLNS